MQVLKCPDSGCPDQSAQLRELQVLIGFVKNRALLPEIDKGHTITSCSRARLDCRHCILGSCNIYRLQHQGQECTESYQGPRQAILGAMSLPGNPYDSHTLAGQINQVQKLTGITVNALMPIVDTAAIG